MSEQPGNAILTYLAAAYRRNPDAEVSGAELEHELGLDTAALKESAAALTGCGMVEWDPLLSNIWLRITDKGLLAAEETGTDAHLPPAASGAERRGH